MVAQGIRIEQAGAIVALEGPGSPNAESSLLPWLPRALLSLESEGLERRTSEVSDSPPSSLWRIGLTTCCGPMVRTGWAVGLTRRMFTMVCARWRETDTPRARSSAANSSPPVGWLQVRQQRARAAASSAGRRAVRRKRTGQLVFLVCAPRDILVRLEVSALGRGAPPRARCAPACGHAQPHPMVGSLVWPREALQLRMQWFRASVNTTASPTASKRAMPSCSSAGIGPRSGRQPWRSSPHRS